MKKEYPAQQVVNWFFENHCTRKCQEKAKIKGLQKKQETLDKFC